MTDLSQSITVAGRTRPVENGGVTLVAAPSLEALAGTIRHEHGLVMNAGKRMIEHAVCCGSALAEAKRQVGHGQWAAWCDRELDFSQQTASFYIRAATYSEFLRESEIDTLDGARRLLAEHQLHVGTAWTSEHQRNEIARLHSEGLSQKAIGRILGLSQTTVGRHLRDPLTGSRPQTAAIRRRHHGPLRKRGRRRRPIAITDDLIEGLAVWLTANFGGALNDETRATAVDALRAALTYDGPIGREDVA